MKITEPAADMAVAAALISSVTAQPLPERSVFFGEVALSAELRQVAQAESRLKEAFKLGFDQAIMPRPRKTAPAPSGLSVQHIENLSQLIETLGACSRNGNHYLWQCVITYGFIRSKFY